MSRPRASLIAVAVALAASAGAILVPRADAQDAPPVCAPGGEPVRFEGSVETADARSYEALPFTVAEGTLRVEATYNWHEHPVVPGGPALPSTPLTQTVFDLGLWDADGLGTPDGFRGWSGSRAGRVAAGQEPVFVQQDVAARGYRPGPIEPGTWWADLGIAAVGLTGADWSVTVLCTAPDGVGPPFVAQPVDATHVANAEPGWYHGDFHAHGYHSNANAREWQDQVDYMRSVGLDIVPITDYVTGQHWDELGPVQDANPDVLIWPGREIITYYGHSIVLGETRSVLDYRHGFPGVSLRDIQEASVRDGALYQVAHPTLFPGPLFQNFCRGCFFELWDTIDWRLVTTMEVLTGPIRVGPGELGLPDPLGLRIPNPFVPSAIELWESLLQRGFRITGVSGSDSKGVEGDREHLWGSSATAVYAEELSRAGITAALQAGHAYVQTRGVRHSPEVEVSARRPDGSTAIYGDTIDADSVTMRVVVRGGVGQELLISRNGNPLPLPVLPVLVTSDPFTYTFTAERDRAGEGPLGTFWRVDLFDLATQSLSTIGNPIFLADEVPGALAPAAPVVAVATAPETRSLPATGGAGVPLLGGVLLAAALVARRARRTWSSAH